MDFFCSSIQFYLLLSPYLRFISFLHLDLYVLDDDGLMNEGSFMQTKHLYVLILIWMGLSLPVKYFTGRSKAVLLLWTIHFISALCLLRFRARLFIDAFWSPERAEVLALVCDV